MTFLNLRSPLFPMLKSLTKAGKPTTYLVPKEIIYQGLLSLGAGLNNTINMSLGSLQPPYWLYKQTDYSSSSFVPTGFNILTTNITHRNWTSLGLPHFKEEVLIDPVGMLTLEPFGWSILPFIYHPSSQNWCYLPFIPPQEITTSLCGYGYQQSWFFENALWFLEIHPFEKDHEFYLESHFYTSFQEPFKGHFGFTVRPFNPLTLGPIFKIEQKDAHTVKIENFILKTEKEISHFTCGNRYAGDTFSLPFEKSLSQVTSDSGLCTARLSWKTEEISSLKIQIKISHPQNFTFIQNKEIKKPLEKNFMLPDFLEKAFHLAVKRTHIFDEKEYLVPGTFFYHQYWFRDASFMMLGFSNANLLSSTKEKLEFILKKQKKEGSFQSQAGEWDSTGQGIFMLDLLCQRYHPEYSSQVEKSIQKAALWCAQKLKKGKGRMPAGISAEHFGPADHYFWDSFWSLYVLKRASQISSRFNQEYQDCFLLIQNLMGEAFLHIQKEILPSSPTRWEDCSCIGTLIASFPLQLFPTNTPWIQNTANYLYQNHFKKGLFFQSIIHTGWNIYLSLQGAKIFLRLNDPRFMEILKSCAQMISPTGCFPEAIHPQTLGGCMGDGDHGWALSEFLAVVCETFIYEENEELILGAGLLYFPLGKYQSDTLLTHHGKCQVFMEKTECQNILSWNFESFSKDKKQELYTYAFGKKQKLSLKGILKENLS